MEEDERMADRIERDCWEVVLVRTRRGISIVKCSGSREW